MTDPRHTTRVLVFQCLCLLDAQGEDILPMLGRFLDEHAPDADAAVRAESLARRIWRQRAEYDDKVAAAAQHWSVARMKAVDRSILRLGVFEILDPRVPAVVAINEAVEIAKDFGSAESPGFVNGILDGVRKSVETDTGVGESAEGTAPEESETNPSE